MQREAVTTQQIEEWKKIFEKYKTLLVPNRKTGQELVEYITSKFNVNKFEDDEANKVVYYNVMENEPLKNKLKGNEKPIPVTFYWENENKKVFIGVDLVSGFYCVEDDEDIWDELCAFQGLDEDDLTNYYSVAEYINCLNKFGMLEKIVIENKQKKVKEILLMPIVCNKLFVGDPVLRNGVIYSGQKYRNNTDEDMSDFAVGFYEIFYRNILKNDNDNQIHILDDYINFSGDTMNSINTISKECTKKGNAWEEYLWKYFDSYHCLANFWILPMHVGRTSRRTPSDLRIVSKSKNGINDYMDKFLNNVKNNESLYKKLYNEYFSGFVNFKDFVEQHCLIESYYFLEKEEIKEYSDLSKHTPKEIVESMQHNIETRAEYISKSKLELKFGDSKKFLWEALWDHFEDLGLTK